MKKILVLGAIVALLAACGPKAVEPADECTATDSVEVVDTVAVDTVAE